VDTPSIPPRIGTKFKEGDRFCYVSTTWNTVDEVKADFTGKVIEVCVEQGQLVNRSDVLAYIERED
jgi:pyruvate carboxylase subunit B